MRNDIKYSPKMSKIMKNGTLWSSDEIRYLEMRQDFPTSPIPGCDIENNPIFGGGYRVQVFWFDKAIV